MQIFDRIRVQDIERRNWQLWVLAVSMILILAGGLALHMYTLKWVPGFSLGPRTLVKGIVGFCVLALLFASYLIDRQRVIGRLRADLQDEKKRNLERRARGNKELLQTLFGPGQFCDRLAMELNRAANNQLPLSGLTISIEVSPQIADSEKAYSAFGEAVRTIMSKLRGEDSIYQFTSGMFGILLPGTGAEPAQSVAHRVADALNVASGEGRTFSFDIRITSFPDQAKTAPEMERLMRVKPVA